MCTLAADRNECLFGRGPEPSPKLMVVLGPQGRKASKDGRYPTGREGELLATILASGFGMNVEDAYVAPAVKCSPAETASVTRNVRISCGHIIRAQARLLSPKAIVAFGENAARMMTGKDTRLGILRGMKLDPFPLANGGTAPLYVTYGLETMIASKTVRTDGWKDLKPLGIYLLDV
jgi:uracil-DNA glycosylase family 4